MSSLNPQLIYPMFAMFLLTAVVLIVMFTRRASAVKTGEVKINEFKTYDTGHQGPRQMVQASRHFSNLFEAPVLFYVVCILGILFSEGFVFTVLAWMYVAARVVHAYIHIGSNKIFPRMTSYGIGWLVLAAMWLLLLIHQLFPTPIA